METEDKPKSGKEATQWKPGQTGNPAGRPKGALCRKTIFKRILEAKALESMAQNQAKFLGEEALPGTVAEQIAATMVIKALQGDNAAADWVFNNAMDKMADKVENTDMTIQSILDSIRKAPKELPKLSQPAPGNNASAAPEEKQCQTAPPLTMPKLPES